MSKRNNILLVILLAAILFFSAFILQAKAAGELWQVLGNKLAPVVNTFGLRIPSLGSSGSPCLVVSANGTVSTSTCGAGGGGASTDKWATSTDSVSIKPNVGQGLIVGSASSTFNGLNVSNSTTTNATSTTLYVAGQVTLGSLSGFLKATAGKVGVALVDLASDITGTLDISANTNLAVSSPITLTGDTVGCQTASAGQNGCLASGDFTTFAGKESVLSFVYPLVRSVNSISTAFGTTTANIFSLLNQFQGNASTTRLSVYHNAYFGATATSTFDSTGALTLATPLAVGSGGTGASSLNNLITLGTHTTGNYVATLADSGASTLTISGSGSETAAVTAGINLANPNTWTGLQQFNRASSTQESAYRAYFGATATSTFDTAGVLTLASPLAVGSGGTGASSLNNLITLGTHTVGNYLATLTSSGSVTVGGSGSETAAGTVDLNMANANIWTALQSFNNASTTGISALSTLYVGRTATSTIIGDNNGTSTLASGLLVGNRGLTVSSLTNCDTIDTDSGGFFKCGTDATGGGGGTSDEKWATSTDSVSITPNVGQGLIVNSASSTFTGVSVTNGTTTNATSTNLKVSGQLSIASLSGFLKATAGVVATAVIDLVNDVGTSILPVTNGGTGWANIQAGAIPYGNGTSRLATTSAGTAGNVLALLSGVPTWTATTTAGTGLSYNGTSFTVNTSQNIATLSNLTSNGFVKTSGGTGALSIDTNTYLTAALTSLGPVGALQTGPAITLATSSTAFNGLTASTTITATTNTVTFTNTLAGTLGVGGGGTGLTTVADGRLIFGGTTASPLATLATTSGAGRFLSLDYTTGRPAWIATSSLGVAITDTTGTLTETRGGTNQTTYTLGDILYASGANTLSKRAIGTGGQVLAVSGGIPTWVATTTAGTGLSYNGTSFTVNTSQNIATLSNLTGNGAILTSGGVGTLGTYAGTSCTNQFVRSLNGSIAATCATVGAADVALANLTATNSTLTFSGTYDGSTARTIGLNLGNANTWTALQQFGNASSTLSSAYRAYFGATATTTIDTAGNIVIPSGSSLTNTGRTDGCATWSSGAIISTGSACGGAGSSPAGSGTELQYRNGGSFGAVGTTAFDSAYGALGIGTTTPKWMLTIASSTAPQLTLADGSLTNNPWTFRSINGNLYIATSSPSTFATSTIPALMIGSTGAVGIGTTSPWAQLSVDITGIAAAPAFAVGSSARTNFLVANNGNVGIGTSSPWGAFAIASTSFNGLLGPMFSISTSSNNFGQLVFVTATSSPVFSEPAVRIGIGTTTLGTAGIQDTLYVNGTINSTYRYEACDNPGTQLTASIAADLQRACNNFDVSEDATGTTGGGRESVSTGGVYNGLQYGSVCSGATSCGEASAATGGGMGLNFTSLAGSASSTPVIETMVSVTSATSSIYMIGLGASMAGTVADYATVNGNGAFFAASTTSNWIALVRTTAGGEVRVDTGVASSSSPTAGASPYRKFRIEFGMTVVRFYIDNNLVASISNGNHAVVGGVSPIVSAGNWATGTGAQMRVAFVRYWERILPFY